MQSHAGGAEADAAKPGAVERVAPRCRTARRRHDSRQSARQGAHALFGDQRGDRVAILRVERLDRVSDRVDARGDGDRYRQAERQIDVVDHRLRQDARAALRRLLPIRGLAENIGHLRAGVGGGNNDLRQVGAQGERLAEFGGRAAADRDRAIRLAASNAARARSVTAIGVCIAAPGNRPAASGPSCATTSSPVASCCGVVRTKALRQPSAFTSSASAASEPAPNTTREGCAV